MPLEIPSLTGLQTQRLGGAAFLAEVGARRGPVLGRNLINAVAVPPFRGTGTLHLAHAGDICTNLEYMAFVTSLLHSGVHSLPPFVSFRPFRGPSSVL